jgi:hypothetical protein
MNTGSDPPRFSRPQPSILAYAQVYAVVAKQTSRNALFVFTDAHADDLPSESNPGPAN